ncbi:MAG TPA: class I tRNA ligase family protein, partial [Paracoccaceae bacterium]|nr:class I tRNA ligase family protein [Paracoccaceae bacterium]
YLLGALDGYTEAEAVGVDEMPELERYMLSLLGELDGRMKAAVDDFDFNTYTRALVDFCNEDLSAFFFDIRKDALYCDHPADLRRRAYRTTLDTMFQALIRYAAPVLVFTAEEVWRTRYRDGESVHLQEWPVVPVVADTGLLDKWTALRATRAEVLEAIEPLRRDKVVRSSLEADVTAPVDLAATDWAELLISSTVHVGDLAVSKTTHHKCGRCWRHLPEVAEDGDLCGRCDDVVSRLDAEAAMPA